MTAPRPPHAPRVQQESSRSTALCSSPSTRGGWPLSPTRSRFFPISTARSRERVPGGTATLTVTSASCCVHAYRSVAPPLPGAVCVWNRIQSGDSSVDPSTHLGLHCFQHVRAFRSDFSFSPSSCLAAAAAAVGAGAAAAAEPGAAAADKSKLPSAPASTTPVAACSLARRSASPFSCSAFCRASLFCSIGVHFARWVFD